MKHIQEVRRASHVIAEQDAPRAVLAGPFREHANMGVKGQAKAGGVGKRRLSKAVEFRVVVHRGDGRGPGR